jgi:hypothetical protein
MGSSGSRCDRGHVSSQPMVFSVVAIDPCVTTPVEVVTVAAVVLGGLDGLDGHPEATPPTSARTAAAATTLKRRDMIS